jgi:hypothetical protein
LMSAPKRDVIYTRSAWTEPAVNFFHQERSLTFVGMSAPRYVNGC